MVDAAGRLSPKVDRLPPGAVLHHVNRVNSRNAIKVTLGIIIITSNVPAHFLATVIAVVIALLQAACLRIRAARWRELCISNYILCEPGFTTSKAACR